MARVSHAHPHSGGPRGVPVPSSTLVDPFSSVLLYIHGMSYEGVFYTGIVGPAHPYDEEERIFRLSVSAQHPPIAYVPGNSAYFHPGENYDHTLGRDPLAVRSASLPN